MLQMVSTVSRCPQPLPPALALHRVLAVIFAVTILPLEARDRSFQILGRPRVRNVLSLMQTVRLGCGYIGY